MGKTAIQSSRPAMPSTDALPRDLPQPKRTLGAWSHVKRILAPIASLRVTVVLFAFAIALVFFGTLAQKEEGLYTVLHKYFRTGIAWIPLQIFVLFGQVFFKIWPSVTVSGRFPFPGGWLIGGLLLANLLAAHLIRFKMSWKRSGILLIHGGLIVMMVSELVAGLFAVEGRMSLPNQTASNYLQDHHAVELAIIDRSGARTDDVVVVPDSILKGSGHIRDDRLPFDIEVVDFMVNSSDPRPIKEGVENLADSGDGRMFVTTEKPEVKGTEEKDDKASAYVQFKKKRTGQTLGTFLVSTWWSDYWSTGRLERPQIVTVDNKAYEVFLRAKRTYKPYMIKLLKFRHDKYMGTETPMNFSSRIRLRDPDRGEDREVLISMNNPLRYGGETFYQSGVLADVRDPDQGTVLQVVRNPGWLMPYFSCAMVALGMLVHFGQHLVGFLRRRIAQ